jgi:hypothetical protein
MDLGPGDRPFVFLYLNERTNEWDPLYTAHGETVWMNGGAAGASGQPGGVFHGRWADKEEGAAPAEEGEEGKEEEEEEEEEGITTCITISIDIALLPSGGSTPAGMGATRGSHGAAPYNFFKLSDGQERAAGAVATPAGLSAQGPRRSRHRARCRGHRAAGARRRVGLAALLLVPDWAPRLRFHKVFGEALVHEVHQRPLLPRPGDAHSGALGHAPRGGGARLRPRRLRWLQGCCTGGQGTQVQAIEISSPKKKKSSKAKGS